MKRLVSLVTLLALLLTLTACSAAATQIGESAPPR